MRFKTPLEIHLLQICNCCEAALGVEMCARIGPNNQHSLKHFWHLAISAISTLNSGTCAIGKTKVANHHCMVSGVKLETKAIGREMSNQPSKKQNSLCTANLDRQTLSSKLIGVVTSGPIVFRISARITTPSNGGGRASQPGAFYRGLL